MKNKEDERPKPEKCYAVETNQGAENCVFPACHCGLPQTEQTPDSKGLQDEFYISKKEYNMEGVQIWKGEGDEMELICSVMPDKNSNHEANAKLICDAVNNYQSLVEQNKKMYDLLCAANSSLLLSKETLYNAGGQNLVDLKHKINTFLNNTK